MAEGYARSRPPVHPHVIQRIERYLTLDRRIERALDIGCGAGLSTAPLLSFAHQVIGIEPALTMLKWASRTVPGAAFVAASAEAIPFPAATFDLISSAGSLNWSDLRLVLPEIRRVMTNSGTFVLYDYGQGRDIGGSSRLARWDDEFKRRYPSPPALTIVPAQLDTARHGLRLVHEEPFDVTISLTESFYLEYALTETNVAEAVSNGANETAIRRWCADTLNDVFQGSPQNVVFRGFIAFYKAA